MDRKTFLKASLATAGCCLAFGRVSQAVGTSLPQQTATAADSDKQFVQNFLSDLMVSIDRELPEDVKSRVIGGCGRACFERFDFKRNWAVEGKDSVEKLIAALQKNFNVEREGSLVHIRYGVTSKGCYCPAAKYRPATPNDIHCYCSRATHQAVWETALGRPIRVDLAESVRRGGKTCHFVVHV